MCLGGPGPGPGTSVCNDGTVEGTEACDGTDPGICLPTETCNSLCACVPAGQTYCGDDTRQTPTNDQGETEACDGTDPGICLPTETCNSLCACVPAGQTYCGDSLIQTPNDMGTGGPANDGNEQCESDGDCQAGEICDGCACIIPFCGNGIVEGTEECDGTDIRLSCNPTDNCDNSCLCIPAGESYCGDSVVQPLNDQNKIEACEVDTDCQAGELCNQSCECVASSVVVDTTPFEINNCEELQMIGYHPDYPLNGNYWLATDIDCSATNPSNAGYATSLWGLGYSARFPNGFD